MASLDKRFPSETTPLNVMLHANTDDAAANSGRPRLQETRYPTQQRETGSWIPSLVVLLISFAVTIIATTLVGTIGNNHYAPSTFVQRISVAELEQHLDALYAAANLSGHTPSRSVLYGYNASAAYIQSQLEQVAGAFEIIQQPFLSPVWEDFGNHSLTASTGNVSLSFALGIDFAPLSFSGSTPGMTTADLRRYDAHACAITDFATVSGRFAVLPDVSPCTLYDRVLATERAGAVGVIVFRVAADTALPSARVRDDDWTNNSSRPFVSIAVVGTAHALAGVFVEGVTLTLQVNAASRVVPTFNLLAVRRGRLPHTVVLGAHLDSVQQSPGINDNGSGCALLLAIANQIATYDLSTSLTTIFAFWGAAEQGLLGSRHFVQTLNTTMTAPVIASLNFDTLGSPNYVRFVFNGTTAPDEARAGSEMLQQLFASYFIKNSEAYEVIPFSPTEGSDYFPFLQAGIPVGSITTGTSGIKTDQERDTFGGLSRTAYDSCYHQACDSVRNLNMFAFRDMARAAAYVSWQIVGSDMLLGALNISLTQHTVGR
eukprot:m.175059 g.175059  ORF g.175059 m.175059 type:complete len:544 (+) comp16545_c0_seq5:446-2077(+)